MRVAEKFISINGEGTHAGELSVFIRFQGCNLSCSYCDTTWANESKCPYTDMTPEEIFAYIKESGVSNVTLTGGEPLLQPELPKLLELLSEDGVDEECVKVQRPLRVEIETNGSMDISVYNGCSRPVFTVDYKLPSSGCESDMFTDNLQNLQREDTLKLVCGDEGDLVRAREIIEEYRLIGKCNIYLSPVFGKIEPDRMVDFMTRNRMNGVRLQLQLHKVIWHPEARGV